MVRRKDKIKFEDTERYKKDLIHEIRFLKDDKVVADWDRLFDDISVYPKALEFATQKLQKDKNVSDWTEIADRYETRSFWNP